MLFRSGFRGIQITSGFFQLWRASGITSEAPAIPAAAAGAKRCAPTHFITGPRRFVFRHSNRSPSSFYGDDARTSTTTVDALPPARLRTAASMPRHSDAPRRPAGAAGCGGAVHRAAVPRLLRLLMVAVATASRLCRWFMVTGATNRCYCFSSSSQSLTSRSIAFWKFV